MYNIIIHLSYRDNIYSKSHGAVAQLARAPALQAGGQEFDSP